tara:strand:+ start:270 stop:590 length:321 start_codon:yes stop_codon:yes gene_type:complete
MKLVSLGSKPEIKIAELTLDNRVKVLFSYGQPVAALIPGRGYVRTTQIISKTTERHIAAWIDGVFRAERVEPAFFEVLLCGAKGAEASSQQPTSPLGGPPLPDQHH